MASSDERGLFVEDSSRVGRGMSSTKFMIDPFFMQYKSNPIQL
jgi:hypothetical protein